MNTTKIQRFKGALLGAFIGDALGAGPHWYYDLEQMKKDYGEWIDDYVEPKEGRYHYGIKKGDLTQPGYILKLLIKNIIENNGYNEKEFCNVLDNDLFKKIDGTPNSGPGLYTSQSIRETYKNRVEKNLSWEDSASSADTTEAIERTLILGAFYSSNLKDMAKSVIGNTRLTQSDDVVGSMTLAYNSILALLVEGEEFDEHISTKLMKLVKEKELPFHSVTSNNLNPPTGKEKREEANFASPDALLTPSFIASSLKDKDIQIEPAYKACMLYGLPCAIYHILPSSYYLSIRFKNDFESAILHSLNGGGQNQARSILVGALVGASVGIDNIPKKFIDGLNEKDEILDLIDKVSKLVKKD